MKMGTKYPEYTIGGKGNLSSLRIISSLPSPWPITKQRKHRKKKKKKKMERGACLGQKVVLILASAGFHFKHL
jgi:hypothetical protein